MLSRMFLAGVLLVVMSGCGATWDPVGHTANPGAVADPIAAFERLMDLGEPKPVKMEFKEGYMVASYVSSGNVYTGTLVWADIQEVQFVRSSKSGVLRVNVFDASGQRVMQWQPKNEAMGREMVDVLAALRAGGGAAAATADVAPPAEAEPEASTEAPQESGVE